jgi:hypothetical protein
VLSAYLNQTAQYQRRTGTDNRGQGVYGSASTVACRKQAKTQHILTATGSTVKTNHVYYLTDSVAEGDVLDGKVVITVIPWAGLGGEIIGYKAAME